MMMKSKGGLWLGGACERLKSIDDDGAMWTDLAAVADVEVVQKPLPQEIVQKVWGCWYFG